MKTDSGVPPETIVATLGDKELLRNYCLFAGFHRARIAEVLFNNLDDDADQRRSIGLEIAANYVAATEDLVLWFFVLRRWRPGEDPALFDLLDSTFVRESRDADQSTERALKEIQKWSIADLRRELGLPNDEYLLQSGLDEIGLKKHINAMRDLLERIRESFELRLSDNKILVTAYNKVKHGVLAFATNEGSVSGISVLIASRSGPAGPDGRKKIDAGTIPCDKPELWKMYASTGFVAEATCTLVNLKYIRHFDPRWSIPPWPFPRRGWK